MPHLRTLDFSRNKQVLSPGLCIRRFAALSVGDAVSGRSALWSRLAFGRSPCLNRLRARDKDALRRIYEKYIEDLLRVAISLLYNIQSAEDCLHDVFVDFAGTVDGSMIHRNLKSYLVSCVANRARDQLCSRARQSVRQREQICSPPMSASPTKHLIDAEESARVFEAMAELPYPQREVFVLRVQGQMRFREIADLLNASVDTVQS